MDLYVLSVDDVIEIYQGMTGNADTPVRPEGLASAVALPMATMFGQDMYPTIFDKAAALMRSIAENQPFLDGNKRTAWGAARVFLEINGVDVDATPEEVASLMEALAAKRATRDDIADFLANHSIWARPHDDKEMKDPPRRVADERT